MGNGLDKIVWKRMDKTQIERIIRTTDVTAQINYLVWTELKIHTHLSFVRDPIHGNAIQDSHMGNYGLEIWKQITLKILGLNKLQRLFRCLFNIPFIDTLISD